MNIPTPSSLELHLNARPEFVKALGKRVKAAGGKYSHARGYADCRFVTIPATEIELIDECLRRFPGGTSRVGTCVIGRGDEMHRLPSWVVVQRVEHGTRSGSVIFVEKFARSYFDAESRGLVTKPTSIL